MPRGRREVPLGYPERPSYHGPLSDPFRLDYIDQHYEGELRGKWVRVEGAATCGCYWLLDINIEKGTATFRQCFDLYGSNFTFAGHSEEHRQKCLAALPPNFLQDHIIHFDTDMTLRDLLERN